ncbi:ATP/GTP-binding protein [Pseudoclavibacter sp. VKM Ac-2888]|uniref:ATP/GTP-binding protein n=1 Tax=Pseudoclavibacter sp. VKM Ac-2888 TaxID=2783830 RepID=UPI00188D55B8|nr:ATP/GTP-binding protein [Pseudoclavibacter sp. VKM Ac-2888]MBF4550910.1 ATP/GTP-binding protein [Pseudoclavibacter sp. VKM Ac-2888]
MASAKSRTREQHIAVFGGSGSGKTVLVSSFYGPTQEPQFAKDNLYEVVADDTGQSDKLYQSYLGMKNAAKVPASTRFSHTAYSFMVRPKAWSQQRAKQSKPFDALRLVWHDYPGEWFEESAVGAEETRRRVETFTALLSSDVALLLVDGQLLLENGGSEELYLKSLLTNIRSELLRLKPELLKDGKPLTQFPRIWVLALSKSDLLPGMDAHRFKALLVEKVSDELDQLRQELRGFVEAPEAMSFAEDFILLSSAKFAPGKIEVTQRVGVDAVLPLAAILPFERHVKWAKTLHDGGKVAEKIFGKAGDVAGVAAMGALFVIKKVKLPGPLGLLAGLAASFVSKDAIERGASLAGDKLKAVNAEALAKRDYLTAMLTRFKLDLEDAERKGVLLRSKK